MDRKILYKKTDTGVKDAIEVLPHLNNLQHLYNPIQYNTSKSIRLARIFNIVRR